MKLIAILAVTSLTVASNSKPRAAGCNADNCLRAIRNTARPGLADCNAYFKTTVTPSAVTQTNTQTVTITTTPTITIPVTETKQVSVTETVQQTATETALITITVAQPVKRETSADIPSYATACSGSVRYSSACSCLGATPVTITATTPTSTVTVTLSQTLGAPAQTVYQTISTQIITTIAAIQTNIIGTVTVTSAKVVTASPALTTSGAYQWQAIQSGQFETMFAAVGSDSIIMRTIQANWFFVSDGTVMSDHNNWYAYYSASQTTGSQIYVQGIQGSLSKLHCKFNNQRLDCTTGNGDFTTLVACGDAGTLYIYKSSASTSDYCPGESWQAMTFNLLRD